MDAIFDTVTDGLVKADETPAEETFSSSRQRSTAFSNEKTKTTQTVCINTNHLYHTESKIRPNYPTLINRIM